MASASHLINDDDDLLRLVMNVYGAAGPAPEEVEQRRPKPLRLLSRVLLLAPCWGCLASVLVVNGTFAEQRPAPAGVVSQALPVVEQVASASGGAAPVAEPPAAAKPRASRIAKNRYPVRRYGYARTAATRWRRARSAPYSPSPAEPDYETAKFVPALSSTSPEPVGVPARVEPAPAVSYRPPITEPADTAARTRTMERVDDRGESAPPGAAIAERTAEQEARDSLRALRLR